MLNGEADYMLSSPPLSDGPALEANVDMIVVKPNMPSRYYIGFNFGRELTGNIKVREAISMAINQEEIVQRAFNGYGKAAEGYFTPAFAWAYNDEDVCPAYDPDAANALLDEAGYPILCIKTRLVAYGRYGECKGWLYRNKTCTRCS